MSVVTDDNLAKKHGADELEERAIVEPSNRWDHVVQLYGFAFLDRRNP
jgi:hypothetical protein